MFHILTLIEGAMRHNDGSVKSDIYFNDMKILFGFSY